MSDEITVPGGEEPKGDGPNRPPLVLVVDDTEGNRYTAARLLRDAGMEVLEAATAAETLQLLRTSSPDLILLDISLPDGSGHDLRRTIRADARHAQVPIMHVSASFIESSDQAYGLDHGADAYMTHPLDPPVFVATARSLLRADAARGRQVQAEHLARQEAEVAAQRATLLQDLTAALARTMSAADASRVVLTRALKALRAHAGLVALRIDDETERLIVGSDNLSESAIMRWRHTSEDVESPLDEALRAGETITIGNAGSEESPYREWTTSVGLALNEKPTLIHTVPMIVDRGPNERVLGAVLFIWTVGHAIDSETTALIAAVADQGALALERARLYAAERKAREAAEAAQAEAEQANAVKSQFLAVMSHELRTPLNAIGGYTELLEMGLRGPVNPQQIEDLRRIRRSQEHLLGLINALLSYAKLEAGHMDYTIERVSVLDTVRAVDSLVAPLAAAHGLRLTTTACDDDAIVLADAEKLRQILLNLVSNAMKFTAKGGEVRVTCERTGATQEERRIVLRVSDTGRGIAAAELVRIFDPFVQVGRTLTSTDAGTGLGLAISRDLARGMGGDLTAESEVGVGSVFRLELPSG